MLQAVRLHVAQAAHGVRQLVQLRARESGAAAVGLQLAVQPLQQAEGVVQGIRKFSLPL